MILIPFEPGHLRAMSPQAAQLGDVHAQQPDVDLGDAWTGVSEGGVLLGCAGLVQMWPGRSHAWALLSVDAAAHMLAITREIRSRLAATPSRRIEMTADAEFPEAQRWAVMLGFTLETPTPMRAYLPGGRDAYLYARVK